MLAWLAPGTLKTLGARALSLVAHRWFHGEVSVGTTESLLTSHDVGTYLVRFSSMVPGGYCLSHVDEEGEVHHIRILRSAVSNASYVIGKVLTGVGLFTQLIVSFRKHLIRLKQR